MSKFEYPFSFTEDQPNQIIGTLELDEPLPCSREGSGFYRTGRIALQNNGSLDLVLYHNPATEKFIYLRQSPPDANLFRIIGVDPFLAAEMKTITLPGQLCLGAQRTRLIGDAFTQVFRAPTFTDIYEHYGQENLAVFPIAREGLKYHVSDALYQNRGLYCDEIVLDAHHVFDSSVPVYNRSVEMTLFKDKDLDEQQKKNIAVAFFADSIASGLVMKEVIARVRERFENLKRVEVIAPLATIRGLCRIAKTEMDADCSIRVHVFETLLNALPPDFYYSAHYGIPEFHIVPALEEEYRHWWGEDESGNSIADTACAGYGWSEVFFSPRKQIEMMNGQLMSRHNKTIADLVVRNLKG
jgi:hypothetical protein